jgi:hypothetical protein
MAGTEIATGELMADHASGSKSAVNAVVMANLPDRFGYYWLTRPGHKTEMRRLVPGNNFKHDARSVEAWECPGIQRLLFDLERMPRYHWEFIPEP